MIKKIYLISNNKPWVSLICWLTGIIIVHLFGKFSFINPTFNVLIDGIFVLGLILAINHFYTHEPLYFQSFTLKRLGWLWLFMILFIIVTNFILFKTSPSPRALKIALRPLFWLFYTLSVSSITLIALYGIFMPAIFHSWDTSNVVKKGLIISSIIFSGVQLCFLSYIHNTLLGKTYLGCIEFLLGMICGLLYLRTTNLCVPLFFSFFETFFILTLTHLGSYYGNLINLILFVLFIIVLIKVILRPQITSQIRLDFKIKN